MTNPQDDMDALVPTTMEIAGASSGPLKGLSFVAKDLFHIEGHTSSFGHEKWRETHQPSATTSPTISRMLAAGADLVGITKMDQLAYSLIGNVGEGAPPRNAADPELFCGGSSSGSAAAVAAGMADVGLGTDTAGSIRVPAAACGLNSLRPSHDYIDPEGVMPLASSFDVVGVLSKRASVIAQVLRIIAPALLGTPAVHSVQYAKDIFETTDVDTARLGRVLADRLADVAGVAVETVAFARFTSSEVGDLFARLQGREIWSNHAAWIAAHGEALAKDVKGRLDRCKSLAQDPPTTKSEDREERLRYQQEFGDRVPSGTVVVLPVMPEYGPTRAWDDDKLIAFRGGCFRLTAPSSFTGAPQAVFSVRSEHERRSIGIGLLTARGGDHLLLDLMEQLGDEAQGLSL